MWCAVLCALFAVAQLASFAHEALNSHVVCAEHGEFIHVAHATASVDAPAASRHATAPQARSSNKPRGAAEHEHCGLTTLNRQRSLAFHEAASVAAAPAPSIARAAVRLDVEHSPIALLLLAPKQSPPL
jgi:hypothetical protein